MSRLPLKCVIISLEEDWTARELQRKLKSIGVNEVEILKATVPSDFSEQELAKNKKLSQVEMAISRSHRRAQMTSFGSSNEWLLILEEDAQMSKEIVQLPKLIMEFQEIAQKKPIAIHLAPEQSGIMVSSRYEDFFKLLVVADCAVAYLINKKASQLIGTNFDYMSEVADWPKIIRKIDWYAPKQSLFFHPNLCDRENTSASSGERNLRITLSPKIQRIRRLLVHRFLLLILIMPFSKKYGKGYSASERIRSRVLTVPKFILDKFLRW